MDPQISIQTTEDTDGNVIARKWLYSYAEDPERGLPRYDSALNVLSDEWRNATSAQRLNEMNVRYEANAQNILNPPISEPVTSNQALLDAQSALQQAQDTINHLLVTQEE